MTRLSAACAAGAPFLCVDLTCQNEVHGETPVGHYLAPNIEPLHELVVDSSTPYWPYRIRPLPGPEACSNCAAGSHDLCLRACNAAALSMEPYDVSECGCGVCYPPPAAVSP